MSDRTVTLKRFNSSNWENVYPKTTIDQVVNLTTQLANMLGDINGKAPLVHTHNYLSSITKAQVEAVLTGVITSHSHNYLSSITKAQVEAVLTGVITSHSHNYLLPSDIYAWAKDANKPSYEFSELYSLPDTLGGYGIANARTATEITNEIAAHAAIAASSSELGHIKISVSNGVLYISTS